MAFTYQRTIHFPDTDTAGVVFFANYLSICHEAYEEALAAAGIDIRRFFADHGIVIPISKSAADYLRPLHCGDKISVSVKPTSLEGGTFLLDYEIHKTGTSPRLVATIRTWHVCIRSESRERSPLPAAIANWIRGS